MKELESARRRFLKGVVVGGSAAPSLAGLGLLAQDSPATQAWNGSQ